MKMEAILKLIDDYWKFDKDQQPCSSWHDKQDLLSEVEKLSHQPDYIEILPDGSNLPNDNEVVMCWHKGEWIKGKMVKVGDSVLWYYEGNTTLTYELPKFYFRLPSSQITNPPAAAEQR